MPDAGERQTERDEDNTLVDKVDVPGQIPPNSALPERPRHLGQVAPYCAQDAACHEGEQRKGERFATKNGVPLPAAGSHKYSTRQNTSNMLAIRSNVKGRLQLTASTNDFIGVRAFHVLLRPRGSGEVNGRPSGFGSFLLSAMRIQRLV